MLNDTMLLETMVNEDHVMDVVGALECVPTDYLATFSPLLRHSILVFSG